VCDPVDLTAVPPLEFQPVDPARFPAVGLARHAGELGAAPRCVLTAANEAAVAAFLDGRCRFTEIVPLVAETLEAATLPGDGVGLDELVGLDAWARDQVGRAVAAVSGPV